MAAERERQHFVDRLRSSGLRLTAERRAVFEELFAQHGHVDADQVLACLRARGVAVSRATVYRNLDLLASLGLARKQRLGRRRYLYEHLHLGQDHDHLVCRGCGRVVEFVSPGIAALQGEICRAHGFSPGHHQLQIVGLCLSCAAAAAAAASGGARENGALRA